LKEYVTVNAIDLSSKRGLLRIEVPVIILG